MHGIDVLEVYGFLFHGIPKLIPPLLKKVRIALGDFIHAPHSVVINTNIRLYQRIRIDYRIHV